MRQTLSATKRVRDARDGRADILRMIMDSLVDGYRIDRRSRCRFFLGRDGETDLLGGAFPTWQQEGREHRV